MLCVGNSDEPAGSKPRESESPELPCFCVLIWDRVIDLFCDLDDLSELKPQLGSENGRMSQLCPVTFMVVKLKNVTVLPSEASGGKKGRFLRQWPPIKLDHYGSAEVSQTPGCVARPEE